MRRSSGREEREEEEKEGCGRAAVYGVRRRRWRRGSGLMMGLGSGMQVRTSHERLRELQVSGILYVEYRKRKGKRNSHLVKEEGETGTMRSDQREECRPCDGIETTCNWMLPKTSLTRNKERKN